MPRGLYVKWFEVVERTVQESMYYRIEVRFNGVMVDEFERPTMREAVLAFEHAGYKRPSERPNI